MAFYTCLCCEEHDMDGPLSLDDLLNGDTDPDSLAENEALSAMKPGDAHGSESWENTFVVRCYETREQATEARRAYEAANEADENRTATDEQLALLDRESNP